MENKNLVYGGIVFIVTCGIIFGILSRNFVTKKLIKASEEWVNFKYGLLVLFIMIFFSSIPPFMGISFLCVFSGSVYGMGYGWLLVAIASTMGSLTAFIFYRTIFNKYSFELVKTNERLLVIAETLKYKLSFLLLVMLRFCPIPFSITNGLLASISEISTINFLISTAISTPKFLVNVFVGSRLKTLGQKNDDISTFVLNIVFLVIAAITFGFFSYLINKKFKQKFSLLKEDDGLI